MFEQDVAGLIKALRANKNDEQGVIEQAIDECRQEIRSSDIDIKAAAVLKLVYLEMLGQPIGFASFAVVECMSSTKFHVKAIGYLAASQSFTQDTEVALLVVNLVKKDLTTPPTSTFATSAAAATTATVTHLQMVLSALATLLTPTLARDLAPDLLGLLSHSKSIIRRQAILLLWKMARSWPGVFEVAFPRSDEDPWIARLRERLEDEDMTVVGATVNLVCELARQDPRTYLPLAPELFGLLTGGTNNWMLIKIVKLFAVLTPHEPRLVKKLVPPLTELIETTPAMSLLYECIQTSIIGGILNGPDGEHLASTCVDKLHTFLEDVDQNLRYIALLAIHKILPTHPHLVVHEYDTVMACLDDPDLAIRSRALAIIEGMVNRDTLEQTVDKLMTQLNPPLPSAARSLLAQSSTTTTTAVVFSPAYKRSVVSTIVRICSADTYASVTDFEWYIDTLVSLAYITRSLGSITGTAGASGSASGGEEDRVGRTIKNALIDVSARVKAIRPYAVEKCEQLLRDSLFLEAVDCAASSSSLLETAEGDDACAVAEGAAWVVGEYCAELADPRPTIAHFFTSFPSSSSSSTQLDTTSEGSGESRKSSSSLPDSVVTSFLHNGTKVYAHWLDSTLANEAWDASMAKQVSDVTAALKARCDECAAAGRVDRASELSRLYGAILDVLGQSPDAAAATNDKTTDVLDEGRVVGNDDDGGERRAPRALGIMRPLFDAFPLNPVNARAQSMVAVPAGLDLDTVLFDVPLPSAAASIGASMTTTDVDEYGRPTVSTSASASDGRVKKAKTATVKKTKKSKRATKEGAVVDEADEKVDDLIDVDSIPIVQLSLDDDDINGLEESAVSTTATHLQKKKKKKAIPVMEVDVDGELPDNGPPAAPVPSATAATTTTKLAHEEPDAVMTEDSVKTVVKKKRKEGKSSSSSKKTS